MKLQLSTFIFILLHLFHQANSQRGGGRSSGGGSRSSGGGSRSSGGSSFRSGGYNTGYNGYSGYNGYNRQISCRQRCLGSYDPNCFHNCYNYYSGGGDPKVIGGVFGGLFGACCLGGLCCYFDCCSGGCRCCKCSLPKGCCCHKLQQLKKKYNEVDEHSIPQQVFKAQRDRIIFLFNESSRIFNFALKQQEIKQRITAQVNIVKDDRFITQINFIGDDKFGSWTAQGYILCRYGQIFLWFYKQYDDKENAGQTDQWQHLIYVSTKYNEYVGLEGKWYYDGYENSAQYSGEWRLFVNPMQENNQKNQNIVNQDLYQRPFLNNDHDDSYAL